LAYKHNSKLSIPEHEDLQEGIDDARESLRILNKYKESSLTNNQKITKRIAIFDIEKVLKNLKSSLIMIIL